MLSSFLICFVVWRGIFFGFYMIGLVSRVICLRLYRVLWFFFEVRRFFYSLVRRGEVGRIVFGRYGGCLSCGGYYWFFGISLVSYFYLCRVSWFGFVRLG